MDGRTYSMKLDKYYKSLILILGPLQKWVADSATKPPALILNKHCPYCQYQNVCKSQAKKDDNLSLLDGMSTPKIINKYEKKGIFTVNQLSYTFRPRRHKIQDGNLRPAIQKPELRALAIRENKIYLQEIPKLTRQPVELYLDIEGIPDQQFNYLLGLIVNENDTYTYHSFWVDTPDDEPQMWQQFLEKVRQYADAPIYHYGSFEPRALIRFGKYNNTDISDITIRLININKYIYGKIYFPVYSNRLKEIGPFIGAKWTAPNASGLQSIVWRHRWEETSSDEFKGLLLTYNEDDCLALQLLTEKISGIAQSSDTLSEVEYADNPKKHSTSIGEDIHSQFSKILKMAYFDYDKNKISLREETDPNAEKKKRGGQKGNIPFKRIMPKADKIIQVPQYTHCPKHTDKSLRMSGKRAEKTIIDLIFTKNGVKKTIIKYVGVKGFCSKCTFDYNPPAIREFTRGQIYGRGFQSWAVYHRLALRLPYASIVRSIEEQFNEVVNESQIVDFVKRFSRYYLETENILIAKILQSPFVHVDETLVNIQGVEHYAWVFTDGIHSVFKMTRTRETTIVHEILSGYKGVLISDFYGGYDSMPCRQQKCLSHLIGDLNDDLWKEPFNVELGLFVSEFKTLIVEILKAVEIHGLKCEQLNKYKPKVDLFYSKYINDKVYKSDTTLKYQKRFIRYRLSLFTFIEIDFIPWNNNAAERALRHLAVQRKISGTFYESFGDNYLLLLGITQSCKFQNKSLLRFLVSKEIDIDEFKDVATNKNTTPAGPRGCNLKSVKGKLYRTVNIYYYIKLYIDGYSLRVFFAKPEHDQLFLSVNGKICGTNKRSCFDSSDLANEFVNAYLPRLRNRFGEDVSAEVVRCSEIEQAMVTIKRIKQDSGLAKKRIETGVLASNQTP
jgi:hypothetical protein